MANNLPNIKKKDKEKNICQSINLVKSAKECEILLRVIDDAKFANTEDLQEIRARIITEQ